MMKETAKQKIDELIERYPALALCRDDILAAAEIIVGVYQTGGKILVCGNGGSASDAEHIVGELMKGFLLPRKLDAATREKLREICPATADYLADNLQAVSLVNETALNTAFANDQAADLVFAQQVLGLCEEKDALIAISTSGNSGNVLHAVNVAKLKGAKTIALTGEGGGKLKALADVTICAPSRVTFKIQECHLPIYHTLCIVAEEEFFGAENS